MGGILLRLRNWWDISDRTQRMVTLGGLGFLVLLLVGTLVFASRPNYGIAYSGLSDEERGVIVAELQAVGIPCKYDQAGVIEVPVNQIDEAHMKLATAGKMPHKAQQWGLSELKESSMMGTPAKEKEQIKAIIEGEVAKSIVTIQGIQSARVHIALPPDQAFVRDQRPATASISLVQSEEQLPAGVGRAIARLVSNAIEGLDMKNVVVVNQRGETIFSGDEEASGSGQTKKIDIDDEVSRKRQRDLQAKLDSVYGPGAVIVSIHADVDLDPQSVVKDENSPKAIPVKTLTEDMSGAPKGKPGGLTGTAGQAPGTPAGGTAGAGKEASYSTTSTQSETILRESTHTESTKALGSIRGMAINVIADPERVPDGEALTKIVQGEMLFLTQFDTQGNAAKKNFAVSVNLVPFDKKSAADAKDEKAKADSAARMQQIISLLPIAALLLVALLVIKQIGKFAKTQLPEPMSALPFESGHDSYLSALGGDDGHGHTLQGGSSNSLLAALGATSAMGEAIDDEPVEVGEIKDRVHVPLEQIKKMAAEKPAVVGMLIKSMLLEDRR